MRSLCLEEKEHLLKPLDSEDGRYSDTRKHDRMFWLRARGFFFLYVLGASVIERRHASNWDWMHAYQVGTTGPKGKQANVGRPWLKM